MEKIFTLRRISALFFALLPVAMTQEGVGWNILLRGIFNCLALTDWIGERKRAGNEWSGE